jgi:predicted NACHT family NTPase
VLTSETLLSLNLIYKRKLKQAQVALDRGDYIATAKHIREARSQPGYYHGMEAFNAWINLYSYLPRKAFSTGWEGSTFEGQEPIKLVNSVSLSRDGRLALSGSGDKTLKLWEIATGRCLRTFEGHTDEVYSVSLSADGRFALSGSGDKTLKLWEVATGRCLHTYEGHRDRVYSVSMSADGRFVLSGSGDKTLKLWEIATGHCLHTYKGHRDRVYSVSMSTDGRFVLSGSGDKTLKLWEIATGHCLHTYEGHRDRVYSVSMSADGRFVLSGSGDKTLKLWERATGHCLHTFEEHTDKVTSVTLSADSRLALSGSRDGTLKLWEVVGDRYLFPFERYIAAVILSLLESSDKTLKLWEVVIGRCLRTFEGHGNSVRSVSLSTDCSLALSGSDDEPLKLWLFDWKLEDKSPANWNKGARLYLEIFLTQHMPYAATLPKDREPTEEEMTLALTRCGTPTWTEEDFQNLLYTLGCVGYGWLRPEGIRQHLEAMAGIKSTANQKMLISPFIRTNRVAVLIFLASYTYLAILLQSIWSLGWLGSLLLPVVPAFLLAWYLANLAIQRTK